MTGECRFDRRTVFLSGAAFLATPAVLRAQDVPSNIDEPIVRRNISSFYIHEWRDHFDRLGKGILLSDTNTMVLQHWTADGEMRIYPLTFLINFHSIVPFRYVLYIKVAT